MRRLQAVLSGVAVVKVQVVQQQVALLDPLIGPHVAHSLHKLFEASHQVETLFKTKVLIGNPLPRDPPLWATTSEDDT